MLPSRVRAQSAGEPHVRRRSPRVRVRRRRLLRRHSRPHSRSTWRSMSAWSWSWRTPAKLTSPSTCARIRASACWAAVSRWYRPNGRPDSKPRGRTAHRPGPGSAHLIAGAGVAHLRQRYRIGGSAPGAFVMPTEFTRSKVAPALSVGGGVDVRLGQQIAVGADVRSAHVFDAEADPDRFIEPAGALSTLRAGSRVSWRF